jgi:hypothetical protein
MLCGLFGLIFLLMMCHYFLSGRLQPWPLEVIGHDGRATNVTMEPGDMVLYESHSVVRFKH